MLKAKYRETLGDLHCQFIALLPRNQYPVFPMASYLGRDFLYFSPSSIKLRDIFQVQRHYFMFLVQSWQFKIIINLSCFEKQKKK
jgi:hypothetical protein